MIKSHIYNILLFLALLSFFKPNAQNNTLEPKQSLSISDGLPHNGVTSIMEDSRGYIWIGTYDGLNKYDGYNLKTYKNTVSKEILLSNRIRSIAEDQLNNLWIGTDNGISVYNYSKEKFTSLYTNKTSIRDEAGPIIREINISQNNKYIVCATELAGVLVFKENQTFLGQYVPMENEFGSDVRFFKVQELDAENYMLSSSVGLLLFNIKTGKFKSVLKSSIGYSSSILKIDDNILFACINKGIAVIEYKTNGNVFSFKLKHQDLRKTSFNSALVDSFDNLWLGTLNNGLIRIDNVNTFKNNDAYKIERFESKSGVLRSSFIIVDTNSNCWYGTFNEGLHKFDIKENPFKTYNVEMNYDFGIPSNNIAYIAPLDAKRVYLGSNPILGSDIGGISLFNIENNSFEQLPFDIKEADVKKAEGIYVDSRKNIWIKIRDKGLFRVRNGSRVLEKISADGLTGFDDLIPRSFAEDKKGNIWIGCLDNLYRVSFKEIDNVDKVESLNSNPYFQQNKLSLVRSLYVDHQYDYIWIGADSDGLIRINIANNDALENLPVDQFFHDKNNKLSISNNFVTSIVRLPNNELWIGTEGGGFCKVINSDKTLEFITFSEEQGLSNNVVKSILFDNEHNLWISTNVGLNKFDTKSLTFKRFSKSDGLPFEDFWFVSAKMDNGYLLFSGLDGLCYFKPEDLPVSEALPKFEFGNISIFNKPISPGDTIGNRVLYKTHLKDQNELVLKHNENVFSIQLNALHFSNPDTHRLKYRLLPINEVWVEVSSSEQFAHYNGLQPGDYTFSAMASNSFNEWTEPKTLSITIVPPFWKTNLAYGLYALLALLLVFSAMHLILRIQKLNHNLQIEQLEKDKVKEINLAKLRFFSNISHELKTPLTLIKGQVNRLYDKFKNNLNVREQLQMVERQSKKISYLVNQVHDFQKAEANVLKLNYSRFTFNDFINELTIDFGFMATNENKILEVIGSDSIIVVSADRDKLEKLFNNILSNAFKYTKSKDTIKVEFKNEEKDLTVSISDSGIGIDKSDLSHIFERFYQSHNHRNIHDSGSGIGLSFTKLLVEMHYGYISAESELGKGTIINVRLPIVKTAAIVDEPKVDQAILSAEKGFEFKSQLEAQLNPAEIKVEGSFSDALIFYAEDNLDMRLFVSKSLSKYFKLKIFSNGQECLEAMDDVWPDLLISDVQMPELNGLHLCRTIKSDIKTSHIPVILLTALTDIEDKIQGIRDGADAYIQKPFNLQHLIARVESLLDNRKQLRERYKIGIPLTKDNNINNRNDNAFLEKLYDLMEDNLENQNLDLNGFAKELYLNRTHFYQKVKALTNLTPFEILKDYRLKKAAELLVQENLTVNEVFAQTGFKSRTHFSKLFKEKYGLSPGKYASNI